MGVTAGLSSNAVDLYNYASGTWSTAQLSVVRTRLVATSVGNVAIFAGGHVGNCSLTLFVEGLLFGLMRVGDCVTFACLRRAAWCFSCMPFCAGGCRLMRATAGSGGSSNAVDLYNYTSGTWSTAQLSVARTDLAATSVGNVAIFAGGVDPGNCSLTLFVEGLLFGLMRVGDGVTLACLRRAAWCFSCMPFCAGGCRLMRATAGSGVYFNAVDLYNYTSGTWSTAQLSVATSELAATSVGNVAIFAGGTVTCNCSLTLFVEGLLFWLMRVGDGVAFACLRRAACCLWCMRLVRLPSHSGHCRL
jgi:hypothetical protein